MKLKDMLRLLAFLALGGAGAALFETLSLPASFLAGPMVAIVMAKSFSLPLFNSASTTIPVPLASGNLILIGAVMGSAVSPDFWEGAVLWPVSMIALLAVVSGITSLVYFYVHKKCGWAREEAFFAGLPGALTMTAALAQERGAPMERIMVVQLVRLFLLIAILPLIITGIVGGDGVYAIPSQEQADAMTWMSGAELVIALSICAVTAFVAHKLKAPAGLLTGAFFASAVLNSTGLLEFELPFWLAIPCYVLMGSSVGLYIGKIDGSTLKAVFGTSFAVFAISLTIAFSGAVVTSWALSISFDKVFLSFAPGGMEAMLLISILLDVDPVFVVTHQLARFMGLIAFLPLVTRYVLGPVAPRDKPGSE